MINARVTMRLLAFLLIAVNLLADKTANSLNEKQKKQVLERYSLQELEISQASKEDFRVAMQQYCLSHFQGVDFYYNYIEWESVEFLKSVKDFLHPGAKHHEDNEHTMEKYFRQLGHQFTSNCTLKDYKSIRDAHDAITADTLFDNYLYDQMTRTAWTDLNL